MSGTGTIDERSSALAAPAPIAKYFMVLTLGARRGGVPFRALRTVRAAGTRPIPPCGRPTGKRSRSSSEAVDRKSVGEGKGVSVRGGSGGRRSLKKKNKQ